MFWIHNSRLRRYKLFDKVNNVRVPLTKHCGLTADNYEAKTGNCNVLETCNLQCLSFIYDVMQNLTYVLYLNVTCNNLVFSHKTSQSCDVHVYEPFFIDKSNFQYYCSLYWNECSLTHRLMCKSTFLHNYKLHL